MPDRVPKPSDQVPRPQEPRPQEPGTEAAPSAAASGAPAPRLLVTPAGPAFVGSARRLATRLGGALLEPGAQARAQATELLVGEEGLALRTADGTTVRVDASLLARPRSGRDLLQRAVGAAVRPGAGPAEGAHAGPGEVVDATAGLGGDSFHLAAAGVRVTMVERVPLVGALLEDALERARAGLLGEAARTAAANLHLVVGDARELLAERRAAGAPPAVILLDPMYPRRGKAALPGKGMALFRELVGGDEDAADLLEAALASATARVVVKRPLKAPPLGGTKPSGSLKGSTTRYDLYAPRGGAQARPSST